MKKLFHILSVLLIAAMLFTVPVFAATETPSDALSSEATSELTSEEMSEEATEIASEDDNANASQEGNPSGNGAITADTSNSNAEFSLDRLPRIIPKALEGFGITILIMCVIIVLVVILNKVINSFSSGKKDDGNDQ